jgi:hypothetical protein
MKIEKRKSPSFWQKHCGLRFISLREFISDKEGQAKALINQAILGRESVLQSGTQSS